jgi:hypothetical protein
MGISFAQRYRPFTVGKEARIQIGTLPAVGCAVLLGFWIL